MSNNFNTFYDGDEERSLVRRVVTEVDLSNLSVRQWTDNELGFRLAVLYPQIDGYGHLTASEDVKAEVARLMAEIERRGYDPVSNLRYNERHTGWGWLPGFHKKDE